MKVRDYLPTVFIGALALLVLGGLGAYWPTLVGANNNPASSASAPVDVVADAISYQGFLTDNNGDPLTGDYLIQFQLYNAETGGTLLWDSGDRLIGVENGLFETKLEIDEDIFNGEELWLAQTVGGELLTPRQELLPSPMAHTLRPGAVIKGTASAVTNSYTLEVHQNNDTFAFNRGAIAGQTTTGNAIYGLAENGRAIFGQTKNGYGVYGFDGGSNPNEGYGGYFYSINGIGVYGYSGADRSHPNIYAPGVYGESNQGVGVYGRGDTSNSFSFNNEGGYFEGGKGLFARGTDTAVQLGYGARIFSNNYRGLYAQSNSGFFDAYFGGDGGISTNGIVDRSGGTRLLAINLGDATVQPGDLVALAGVSPSPENGESMLGIAKVDGENQKAVIGVAAELIVFNRVDHGGGIENADFSPAAGNIKSQSYLVIITDGLAPAVNLDAVGRQVSWEIGDKLAISTSGTFGRAAASEGAIVVGKVAGSIDAETGTIPLFIDID